VKFLCLSTLGRKVETKLIGLIGIAVVFVLLEGALVVRLVVVVVVVVGFVVVVVVGFVVVVVRGSVVGVVVVVVRTRYNFIQKKIE